MSNNRVNTIISEVINKGIKVLVITDTANGYKYTKGFIVGSTATALDIQPQHGRAISIDRAAIKSIDRA